MHSAELMSKSGWLFVRARCSAFNLAFLKKISVGNVMLYFYFYLVFKCSEYRRGWDSFQFTKNCDFKQFFVDNGPQYQGFLLMFLERINDIQYWSTIELTF